MANDTPGHKFTVKASINDPAVLKAIQYEVSATDDMFWVAMCHSKERADQIATALNANDALEEENAEMLNALKQIASLWPEPPNGADIMSVNGVNDGKSRAIIADAAIKVARATLAKIALAREGGQQ